MTSSTLLTNHSSERPRAGYEAFKVWNAKIAYRHPSGVSFSLAADKLFDRSYYQYYKATGRTWFAELRWNY